MTEDIITAAEDKLQREFIKQTSQNHCIKKEAVALNATGSTNSDIRTTTTNHYNCIT